VEVLLVPCEVDDGIPHELPGPVEGHVSPALDLMERHTARGEGLRGGEEMRRF